MLATFMGLALSLHLQMYQAGEEHLTQTLVVNTYSPKPCIVDWTWRD